MQKLKELKEEYQKYKSHPFPKAPKGNDELESIFCDLNLFDSYVAGSIEKILLNKTFDIEQFSYDEALEDRLNHALGNLKGKDISTARSYLSYMGKMKLLINSTNKFLSEKLE